MAAPTKRTPDVRKVILDALELGATKQDAAHAAGVSYDLFNDWCNADGQFLQSVKAAQSRMRVANLRKLKRAADGGTWQAAAWLIERTDPDSYGRTVQEQRHVGKDGAAPIKVDHGASAQSIRAWRDSLLVLGLIDGTVADAGGVLPPSAD